MKKAIIFYYSFHHENTKKMVDAIAAALPVRIVSVPVQETADLSEYDLVGFASGVYMSKFGKPMEKLMEELPGLSGKPCFTLYTCGAPSGEFAGGAEALLKKRGAVVEPGWHCRGFDTFGPFKLVGGIAKGRPDERDAEDAVRYMKTLLGE
jgi:flavodoxin